MSEENVTIGLTGLRSPRGYQAQRNLWTGWWTIELEPGLNFNMDAEGIAEIIDLLQACQREDGA